VLNRQRARQDSAIVKALALEQIWPVSRARQIALSEIGAAMIAGAMGPVNYRTSAEGSDAKTNAEPASAPQTALCEPQ
jgi:hypothetical protein